MIYNAAILLHEVDPKNWAASIHYWIRVSLPQKADGSTGWSEELKLWSTSEDLSHLESKAGDISLCICSRRSPEKFTSNQRATSRKTKYSIYALRSHKNLRGGDERQGLVGREAGEWRAWQGLRLGVGWGIVWEAEEPAWWGLLWVRPWCVFGEKEGMCRKKERGKEVL